MTTEIGDQMLFCGVMTWMIRTQEVIMSFIFSTCWAIGAIAGISMMDNVTNWEDAMRPLAEEGGLLAGFATT